MRAMPFLSPSKTVTMKDKYLILTAKALSLLFTPFYFPVLAFVALFSFSYLKLLPFTYQLIILAMVYVFTVLLPLFTIYLYRRINGWTRHQLGHRQKRVMPYLLSITSYGCCLYLMHRLHMPRFMMGIIVAALSIQVVCAVVNGFIKVSTHSAAAGGVIGALLAFSAIFAFDPTFWLCLSILMAGAVGSSRIILRQHNLHEIGLGVTIGFFCGLLSILLV